MFIGGPGTGKSTVLDELKKQQYHCMEEISREVTLQAQKQGIDQLFLTEPLLFSQKLLEGREQQYINADKTNTDVVFFDRGIPSIYAYMRFLKTDFPDVFLQKSNQYRYTKVFQFLPWKEIYTSDNERYENYEESVTISNFLYDAYNELSYDIVTVPFGTVKDRCNFILNSI